MFLTSLALLTSLQSASGGMVAISNDNPETWSVEYPRIIRPFVAEYRQCLNVSNRIVTGEPDFERQHRMDLGRCAEERGEAKDKASAAMDGAKTRLNAAELDTLFDNIGLIHIARGRDLDQQFMRNLTATETATTKYESNKPKGLVLDLVDGSVVKSRAELAGSAQEAGQPAQQTPNSVGNK
ncbi:MAG: hypothetical protein AAFY19_10055 [Pseudomonadota bacterium]